jgi:hypothetical protein
MSIAVAVPDATRLADPAELAQLEREYSFFIR